MTKKPTKPGAGTRVLKTRIKKKSGLKESSRRWLERHINDPYVQRSKADGYRSRAAYKLIEIDDRHQLLKPGAARHRPWRSTRRLVPGGGGADRSRARQHPRVVGIDYLDMDPVPGASSCRWIFSTTARPPG